MKTTDFLTPEKITSETITPEAVRRPKEDALDSVLRGPLGEAAVEEPRCARSGS